MRAGRRWVWALSASVLTVALAACGGGGGSAQGGGTAVEGDALCPEAGTTGAVSIGMGSPLAVFAPFLLAQETGAFERAGIDVTIEKIPSTDSLPLVAQGKIDGQMASMDAGKMNVVAAGVDLRWVMPLETYPEQPAGSPVPGYYAQTSTVGTADEPDYSALVGKDVSSPTGLSSNVGKILDDAMAGAGLGIADVNKKSLLGPDALAAVENNGVAAGWIASPLEAQAAQDPDLRLIASYPVDQPTGTAFMAGPSLLDQPQVLVKMIQVMSQVAEQYLQGDYRQDPETAALLAKAEEIDQQLIAKTALLAFDPEFSMDGLDEWVQEFQQWSSDQGELEYDDLLPSDQIIDTRYVEAAQTCDRSYLE